MLRWQPWVCSVAWTLWLSARNRRDFLVDQPVQRVHQSVDFCLVLACVRRRVGGFGFQDAVNQVNNRSLLFCGNVWYRELLPIVRVKVNVTAAICAQEITCKWLNS